MTDRIIGYFEGAAGASGQPLLFVLGAVHGNEPCGPTAVREALDILKKEALRKPSFEFNGRLVAAVGNVAAFEEEVRFLENDLNRIWQPDFLRRVWQADPAELRNEMAEARALLELFKTEIEAAKPSSIWLLDLHSTSARGGIFSIPSPAEASERFAASLGATAVRGLLNSLGGALLDFFDARTLESFFGWPAGSLPPVVGAAFEAGQHLDPESASRAVAAIAHCLRYIGCIAPGDMESLHEAILRRFTDGLPTLTEVVFQKRLKPDHSFVMRPGFENFQRVSQGEHLGDEAEGPVFAPMDGLILMPLYQKQGNDGFFIVREL